MSDSDEYFALYLATEAIWEIHPQSLRHAHESVHRWAMTLRIAGALQAMLGGTIRSARWTTLMANVEPAPEDEARAVYHDLSQRLERWKADEPKRQEKMARAAIQEEEQRARTDETKRRVSAVLRSTASLSVKIDAVNGLVNDEPTTADLRHLRSGRDSYSSLGHAGLVAQLGRSTFGIENAIPDCTARQAIAMRWMLRGLSEGPAIKLAIASRPANWVPTTVEYILSHHACWYEETGKAVFVSQGATCQICEMKKFEFFRDGERLTCSCCRMDNYRSLVEEHVEEPAREFAEDRCQITASLQEYDPCEDFAPSREEYEQGSRAAHTPNSVLASNRHTCTNYEVLIRGLDRDDHIHQVYYFAIRARIDELINERLALFPPGYDSIG